MGYFSKLHTAVLELAELGLSNAEIADRMDLAEDEVEMVVEEAHLEEYEGQPTELEEWMSFDPDC